MYREKGCGKRSLSCDISSSKGKKNKKTPHFVKGKESFHSRPHFADEDKKSHIPALKRSGRRRNSGNYFLPRYPFPDILVFTSSSLFVCMLYACRRNPFWGFITFFPLCLDLNEISCKRRYSFKGKIRTKRLKNYFFIIKRHPNWRSGGSQEVGIKKVRSEMSEMEIHIGPRAITLQEFNLF